MSERERMADSQTWSDYTMNTVIVNVSPIRLVASGLADGGQISGPDQVDLHMTDLPGEFNSQ